MTISMEKSIPRRNYKTHLEVRYSPSVLPSDAMQHLGAAIKEHHVSNSHREEVIKPSELVAHTFARGTKPYDSEEAEPKSIENIPIPLS